jgi:hypothetical protein
MWERLSIDDQPLSVVVGEMRLDEAVLSFLTFAAGGLMTCLAALADLFLVVLELALALAIKLATGVYSQLLCRFTQARQGRARSHLVFRSTHSRQDRVGLLRLCLAFTCSPLPALSAMGSLEEAAKPSYGIPCSPSPALIPGPVPASSSKVGRTAGASAGRAAANMGPPLKTDCSRPAM